jgi:spermidine synthase
MTRGTWKVGALLFGSGACALIYQTSWLRQFRVIFGTSTYATAAVLAIFMGGLGLGSAFLGRRADASERPLAFYGKLEIAIALSAAITPLILLFVRWIYIASGGSASMGLALATIVRLVLSALVLAVPTMLMGGTLPAAARAVETNDDAGRKRLALLYGMNTLGAVTGTLVSSFYLLEHLGNRGTLFMAVVVNVIVGAIAIASSRSDVTTHATVTDDDIAPAATPRRFVLVAAGTTGFVFLLMELVWYRMLSPLLGGTTFMFGLILAVALAGIGLGGAAYSLWSRGGTASAGGFALTCTLEALFVIIPYALGDRIALFTLYLQPVGTLGFLGHVLRWTMITAIVVFPAAFVSGVQFPLMISLLGRGREGVGHDVGLAYAWNTAGAIAGSLLGGFGLLPLLTAPGAWQLVAILLTLLGFVAVLHAVRQQQRTFAIVAVVAAVLAILGTRAIGPTAPWRHSGIGAARAKMPATAQEAYDWIARERRTLLWDADGRESSIALYRDTDLSLIVNGKSDGTARADAGTQVMSGMLPALFHPNPRTCAVVGLGTGTTAGWLGSVSSMQRVDAIELEPVVVDGANAFAVVNRHVLRNPKVHITVGDAREILVTSRRRYDIIFSEPSNPYRAGIASLYTREWYRSAADRLNDGGIFAQWMQTYAADADTIRTVYGTLHTVFPYVETWWTTKGDLLLMATKQPLVCDANALRQRMRVEPFRSAIHDAWRVESLEGVYSHFIASARVANRIARGAQLNTDDRTIIEFSFARTLALGSFSMMSVFEAARQIDGGRPTDLRGPIDWKVVEQNRATAFPVNDPRYGFALAYEKREYAPAYDIWQHAGPWQPVNSHELMTLAWVLADANDPNAEAYIAALRRWQSIEADAALARLRMRQKRNVEAAQALLRAYGGYRTNPWPMPSIMRNSFDTAMSLAGDHAAAPYVIEALRRPFSEWQWEDARDIMRVGVAEKYERCGASMLEAFQDMEPNVPWRRHILELRADCYTRAHLPLAERARRDFAEYVQSEPPPLLK